jgi:hypothetical protein
MMLMEICGKYGAKRKPLLDMGKIVANSDILI